jgi:diacylglycerol kinase (ATP)
MVANDTSPVKPTAVVAEFSFKRRLQSFRHGGAGVGFMLRTQQNAWIHLLMTLIVCLAGFWFRISAADWRWLTIAITLVWAAEAMNTAFEYLCDVVSPEFHVSVAKAKDIAAGAVLILRGGRGCTRPPDLLAVPRAVNFPSHVVNGSR